MDEQDLTHEASEVTSEGQSASEEAKRERRTLEELLASATPEETAQHIRKLRGESAEYRKQLKELRAQVESFQKQLKAYQEREAAQQGEWEKLARARELELERAQSELSELQRYREAVEEMLEERLKRLPEGMRKRVPQFPNPVETLRWLEANGDLFKPVSEEQVVVNAKPRKNGQRNALLLVREGL